MEERRRPRAGGSAGGGGRRPSSRAAGAALRRKVRELRRLVSGGEEAPAARVLLARTADYIVWLRARVELLRALAAVYGAAPAPLDLADGADAASADADACAA